MMQLTDTQSGTLDTLTGMGFEPTQSRQAALVSLSSLPLPRHFQLIQSIACQKFNANIEAAVTWIMEGAPPSPSLGAGAAGEEDIPPLISADDELPHPSTINIGKGTRGDPPPYAEAPPTSSAEAGQGEKKLPVPYEKQPTMIDLTGEEEALPSAPKLLTAPPSSPTLRLSDTTSGGNTGDDDLKRALEASKAEAGGDDDLSKAMALSMASLGDADQEEHASLVDSIPAEERIREDLSVPPVLRSASPHQSGLSAYLQSLYALPTWRNAILSYRTPERSVSSGDDYKDYWRGDGGMGLGLPMAARGEAEERENRLIALQRLFALMTLTRRSFLHVAEVARVFGIREGDFSKGGGEWVWRIKALHEQLVEDLRMSAGEEVSKMLEEGKTQEETARWEKQAQNRFFVEGRPVKVDEHIGAPFPPLLVNQQEQAAVIDLRLEASPSSSSSSSSSSPQHRQDLYSLLDQDLVTHYPPTSTSPASTTFHLLTNSPSSLLFHLIRYTPVVTSLADFGGGGKGGKKIERKAFRPSSSGNGGEQEKEAGEGEIWLDRYHVKNRKRVAEARRDMELLRGEKEELERRRREVGWTKEGGEVRELVRRTVEVLQKEEGEGGGEGSDERREKQRALRERWEQVGKELEGVLDAYEGDLTALDRRIASLFSSSSSASVGEGEGEAGAGDWFRVGPYRLCAILVRNGLNGRGSAWSVVRGGDGKWWKIVDLVREEITLESALEDPTGLSMDAGPTFFFYQKVDMETELAPVPAHLARIAHLDNYSLASSLPPSHAHLVSSWNLPLLETLSAPTQPSPTEATIEHIPLGLGTTAGMEEDDGETVKDIVLDDLEPTVAAAPDVEGAGAGAATPMSVDEEGGEDSDAPLRLRGGASLPEDEDEDEADDDEDEDEDGYDEDEVELGLLQPMPRDWDVDYAVGKVGGLPKWLDPRSALRLEDVECGACKRTMGLLLQVNAPDDSHPHSAARSLYLFICRTPSCLSTHGPQQAIRIWRTQMPSPNDFFPHTEETRKARKEVEDKLDAATGLDGRSEKVIKPFKEWDVVPEEEPWEESYLPDSTAQISELEEGTEDADEPDTKPGVDAAFLAFQERIEREPKQVMRFYRLPGVEDPQPLWASSRKIQPSEVPTCELCRGERKIEFQILSTLLPSLSDDTLDFDSVLIYTCINHCEIPKREGGKTGWASEVCFKQDFAAEGVRFGMDQLRRELPTAQ
ncbi:hypothetical protein JCM11641_005493 [Rhodosporidiobolus odoratus]